MADLVICERQNLVDIADAIRSKISSNEPMTLNGMVENINGINGTTEPGSSEVLTYATQFRELFYKTAFPQGYELTLNLPNAAANINSMFRLSTGLKKLTLAVPTENADGTPKTYNMGYFVYASVNQSSLEEIVLPDGIKVSDFTHFARYSSNLRTITGSIDLSEAVGTGSCFARCYALQEVRFVPSTIKLSIDFSACENLSDSSIASIVLGLADLSEQTTQTLTVSATVYDKILRMRDEHAGESESNPYDPLEKNWTIESGG